MTEVLTKLVVDCSTGETTEIALTAEEIAQREADAAAFAEAEAAREAEAAQVAADKASAIEKLGAILTPEEIAALIK